MRDPIILLVHLIATLARLMGPGGRRSVVAESVLVKQQLLILNRSRHRAPNLCASDRILAGVCALFMRPARVIRSAIVLRPSPILEFHRALRTRKYRWLFSPKRRRTGPQGPSKALVDAIVDRKRRNPRWGCPRIAQQIALAFAVDIDKDVVRRVLATHSRPAPHSGGPSWLTFLGHAKDSLWSIDLFRCESAILRSQWVLVVMDQYTPVRAPFDDTCQRSIPVSEMSDNDTASGKPLTRKLEVESSALRLARYLREFVGLRTTTVRDVTKYDSVLWFGDMPQDPDCRSGAWTDDDDLDRV